MQEISAWNNLINLLIIYQLVMSFPLDKVSATFHYFAETRMSKDPNKGFSNLVTAEYRWSAGNARQLVKCIKFATFNS